MAPFPQLLLLLSLQVFLFVYTKALVILKEKKSGHGFALKTDAKCPPPQHFEHLISHRRAASFTSLKQKAPYSSFMFLGVSQRSEYTSPLISIHAANKGIPVLSAPNQDRRGSWTQVSPASREILPQLCGRKSPDRAQGYLPLPAL